MRRVGWIVIPLIVVVAMTLGLPPGAVPGNGTFPLSWLWTWTTQRPASAFLNVPQQQHGPDIKRDPQVPTSATDLNGLSDGPATPARQRKPWTTPNRTGSFSEATSTRIAAAATERSDMYANADGTYARTVYQDPVNFKAADGSWKPIDRSLARRGDGRLAQKAASTDFTVAARSSDARLVTINLDAGHAFSYGLAGAADVPANVNENSSLYPGVLSNVDLKLEVLANGVKESLILRSAAAPASFVFPFDLVGLTAALGANGSVELTDAAGVVRASLPAGFMQDSRFDRESGDFTRSDAVIYELVDVNGRRALKVTPDAAWLRDPARVYPVTLDPSTFMGTGDTYVYKTSGSDHSGEDNLPVGTYDGGTHVARSLMHFDGFSTTYNGATITGASLWTWLTWTYDCTARKVEVKPINAAWNAATVQWPGPALGAAIGSATPNAPHACANDGGNRAVGDPVQINLTPLTTFQNWLTGSPNYGLALTAPSETTSNQWKRFTSRNFANYLYQPRLIVYYTGPGTPQIDAAYPASGYNSPTLTPTLIAEAHDPDGVGSPFTYQFQVYDSNGTMVENSGRIASSSFQVGPNKLARGQSYSWAVVASDGSTESPPSVFSLSTLPPQPPVTSGLAQNGMKGFEPSIGNYTTSATDVKISTVGPDLTATRIYNSLDRRTNLAFGTGWSSQADMRITELDVVSGVPQVLSVTYASGQEAIFGKKADGSFASPLGRVANLSCLNASGAVITCPTTSATAITGYRLLEKDGTAYTFAATIAGSGSYALTSITDFSGRVETLTYNAGTLQLAKITSASGRALSFTWSAGHILTVATDELVAGTPSSRSIWTYTYVNNSLTKVCPPDEAVKCTQYTYSTTGSAFPSLVRNLAPTSNWRLTDAVGSSIAASSVLDQGGADNGVASSVAFGQSGPLVGATGSKAAQFNGSSSVIALPNTLANESGYRSASVWFNTTTPGKVLLSQSTDALGATPAYRGYTPTLFLDAAGKLAGQFPTAPQVGYTGSLGNGGSGLCIDTRNGSASAGTPIQILGCVDNAAQKWTFNPSTRISGIGCIDGGDGSQGRLVVSNPCDSSAGQKWRMDANGNIVLISTGRCLSSPNNSSVPGTQLMMWDCRSTPLSAGQIWFGSAHTPITSPAATPAVTDGNWHHAVLTASGGSQTLYLDGVVVGSKTGLVVGGGQKYQYIGAGYLSAGWLSEPDTAVFSNQGAASYFNGRIGEVAFFDRPLTANEVLALKAARDTVSRPLTEIKRPSGNIAAAVTYDEVSDVVSGLTDEFGGHWAVSAPTAQGSYLVHSSTVLGASPSEYWRLAETGVSDAVNEVNGGTATYMGAVLLGATSGPFGDTSWAGSFDGASAYLKLPPGDVPGTGAFSVGMWFRAQTGMTGTLYSYQDQPIGTVPSAWAPALYVGTDHKLHGKFWTVSGGAVPMESMTNVDDGIWHHAVLSTSGTSQMLYLDGNPVAVSPLTGALATGAMTIGSVGAGSTKLWPAGQDSSNGYFTGDIAEVSLYRSQISGSQAMAQYSSRAKATGTSLVKKYVITDPTNGSLTTKSYELPSGRMVAYTDALGAQTRLGYDAMGALTTATDPNGNYSQSTHDVRGNTTEQTSCLVRSNDPALANCSTIYYTYTNNASNPDDPCNNRILTSRDGRSVDENDPVYKTTYAYDAKCNIIAVTDPLGRKTSTAYTGDRNTASVDSAGYVPAGLPIRLTSAGGSVQTVGYYANGDVASVTDAGGKVTKFEYDRLGRLVKQTESTETPAVLVTEITYDKQSRVKTQKLPSTIDQVVNAEVHQALSTFSYDYDGHTLSQKIEDLGLVDPTREVRSEYNSFGLRTKTIDALGKETVYTYDTFGNALTVKQPGANGATVVSEYDANGRLVTSGIQNWTGDPDTTADDVPLKTLSSTGYDPAGRVSWVSDAEGRLTRYTYYDDGKLWKTIRTDGAPVSPREYVVEVNEYDKAGNIVKQTANNGATVTTFQVDVASRPISSTLDPAGLKRTTASSYDADDHLIEAKSINDVGAVLGYRQASFDPLGRVLSQTTFNGPAGTDPLKVATGRWKLEDSGTDSAGNNPLTATGGPLFDQNDHATGFSKGTLFNGSGRITGVTSAVDTRNSFTVAAWVKLDTSTATAPVTIVSQDGRKVSGFNLYYNKATGLWSFAMPRSDAPGQSVETVTSAVAATNAWTHVAAVYDAPAKTMKLYVNGVQSGATVNRTATPWSAPGRLVIGDGKAGGELNNRTDLFIQDTSGIVKSYSNTGQTMGTAAALGAATQLSSMNFAGLYPVIADWTGDAKPDYIGRDSAGDLWLYPHTGGTGLSTFTSRTKIGTGFGIYNYLGAADLDGDGRAELLTRETATGKLFYHPNAGGTAAPYALGAPVLINTANWNPYNWIYLGDINGDGRADLMSRNSSTNNMYLYKNLGAFAADALFAGPEQVGAGWGGYTVSTGDLNGDGKVDLIAKDSANSMWLYPNVGGTGTGTFGARVSIPGTWTGFGFHATANFDGDTASNWRGSLNDVQIYQRALTQAEVNQVKGLTLPAAGSSVSRVSYTLDRRGMPTQMFDPLGNETGYVYDEGGRQVSTRSAPFVSETGGVAAPLPAGSLSVIGYNTFGEPVRTKDPNGKVTFVEYDKAGRPVKQTMPIYVRPDGVAQADSITSRVYNETGQVIQQFDGDGNPTSFVYDQLGRVRKVTTADTKTTRYRYDMIGNVTEMIDQLGHSTSATYDFLGRKCTATDALANTTTYHYGVGRLDCQTAIPANDPGRLTEVDSPAHVKTRVVYNAVGEVVDAYDSASNLTHFTYDGMGRVTAKILPDLSSTAPTYDLSGAVLANSTYTNGSATPVLMTSQTYDAAGRIVSSTDANQHISKFTYNAVGLLVSQREPTSAVAAEDIVTTYGYDQAGNQTRFTNGNNNAFITTYNAWNLPESSIEPSTPGQTTDESRTFTASYDKAGRVATQASPGSVKITNHYNSMNRLTSQDGTIAGVGTTRSYDYDAVGRPWRFSGPSGLSEISYDNRGLPLNITKGGVTESAFTWNVDGQMASRTDAAGATTYDYDTSGRLWKITNGTSLLATYGYDNMSRVSSITYGGSRVRLLGYEAGTGRPQTDELKTSASGSTIGKIAYTFDANGNEKTKTTTGFGGATISNTYHYDFANRLKSWNNGTNTVDYEYDKAGNRWKAGGSTFVYDARNRLVSSSAGAVTYEYTSRGTLAKKKIGSVEIDTATDAFGQVTSQEDELGVAQSYTYDALGRSVLNGHSYSGTGNQLAKDSSARYIRAPGGELVATTDAAGANRVNVWTDLHSDVVAQFADSATSLTKTATYDPFGKVVGSSTLAGSLGYQSEWTDSATKRVNMAARWYNPETGQFDSRDTQANSPAGSSVNANRYAYANVNPLTGVDPSGHHRVDGVAPPPPPAPPHCGADGRSPGTGCANPGGGGGGGSGDGGGTPTIVPKKDPCATSWGPYSACATDPPKPVVCPHHNQNMNYYEGCTDVLVTEHSCRINGADIPKEKLPKGVACTDLAQNMDKLGNQYEGYADGSNRDLVTAVLLGEAVEVTAAQGEAAAQAAKEAQCQADFWCRNASVIGTIAGVVAGAVAGAVCMAATAGAGSVGCAFAAGFVGGFVGSLTTGLLEGKEGMELWGGALIDGVIGGVIGVLTLGAGAALGAGVRGLLRTGVGKAAAKWATGASRSAASKVASTSAGRGLQVMRDTAIKIESKVGSCTIGTLGEVAMEARNLHSFDPDTLVLMAGGAYSAIKDIKIGDKVVASDPETGATSEQPVTALHVNQDLDLTDLTISSQQPEPAPRPEIGQRTGQGAGTTRGPTATVTLHTTQHHPFWDASTSRWIDAAKLVPNKSVLVTADGQRLYVTGVDNHSGTKEMRDLTVATVHTYYVIAGDTPVLVHNCGEIDVYHATTSPRAAEGVLGGIDPAFFNPNSRFGPAFHVTENADTAVAELAHHGATPTNMIRFTFDPRRAVVLDLTDSAVAKSWGWGYSGGPISGATRDIGPVARASGYTAIKYPSMRGEGANWAILSDFDNLLRPQMVTPM
ncbi:hypothetical protein Rhe02_51710 [Rhizocola hellebori]|uniref:Uncharacterized protein n=1 Tax=Rhizocola hellebori TaxID=1392758 RepID=A0A8J3VH65_9ACTN|nr:LamG-like jellyroll fold domain-containing protein [Rhizocola hellebori]GIH07104.1 hypothetical protein Rhe02_51710 [Rhizocola hellebori]